MNRRTLFETSRQLFKKKTGFVVKSCSLYTKIDELLCAPKIKTLLLPSKFGNEKSERESNPIPYPEQNYFSRSAFLINLIVPKNNLLE